MSDSRGKVEHVEGMALERLRGVVGQRSSATVVWRSFLVAQVAVRASHRRREMTTQKILLIGHRP